MSESIHSTFAAGKHTIDVVESDLNGYSFMGGKYAADDGDGYNSIWGDISARHYEDGTVRAWALTVVGDVEYTGKHQRRVQKIFEFNAADIEAAVEFGKARIIERQADADKRGLGG